MSGRIVTHGIARAISPSLPKCELTHLGRAEFDLALARAQHSAYVAALESAGVCLRVLPEDPSLPDSSFVEDPLLILNSLRVMCQPAKSSRLAELAALAPVVAESGLVHQIQPPGTLEGGDVLEIGQSLYVGLSSRTNRAGFRQLEALATRFGYRVKPVPVRGCLHLKTAITSPANGVVLANPAWVDLEPFRDFEIISVAPAEPFGANTLEVNGRVLVSSSAPRTADILESRGISVQRLDISELHKAEAGLTCLSVLFSGVSP